VEELRKMGDIIPPRCPKCDAKMEKVITPVTTILKGQGWNHGQVEKLRKRSESQGKKFFRRHPDKQKMVSETISKLRKEE